MFNAYTRVDREEYYPLSKPMKGWMFTLIKLVLTKSEQPLSNKTGINADLNTHCYCHTLW